MILSSELGRPVREARKQQGLTQAELARRAGVSRQTVLRLENGGDASITLDKLDRILGVLGLQLNVAPFFNPASEQAEGNPLPRATEAGPAQAEWNRTISDRILQEMRLDQSLVEGTEDYKGVAASWEARS